ncbi:hypothetical protein AXE65_09595 [Ventosimonas gracilis]|uniref:DUF1640 domain-containing protein n=2 Tax=Ventosimonas gracilis TaxID=1680762 RepID=A0A139SXY7_9GAMM|nr:hypothetical protein AXE65_09595 [Ventosimonas gracilis]
MAAAAFDTAEYIEALEKEGIEHNQARAFVKLVWRSHEAVLATQAKEQQEISARTAKEQDSKTEHKIELLRKDMGAVEERLNGKLANLETGLRKDMEAVEERLNGKLTNAVEERLNGKLTNLETGLRKDMEALGNKLIIRLTLAMLGVLGVAGTILSFVLRTVLMK